MFKKFNKEIQIMKEGFKEENEHLSYLNILELYLQLPNF